MRPSLLSQVATAMPSAMEEDALARGVWLLAAASVVSLSLPLSVQGRASGVAALWHSAA
jgi:hypothetical protein